ncbi:MAG: hypothetical protein ABI688_07150 [Bacteroidota bacterium]
MKSPAHTSLHRELSVLALFIAIPEFIASPVIVGLKHIIHADNIALDIREILDFLVISFPLTLSVAILFVIIEKGKFNLFYLLLAVVGAALLSNLLHMLIGEIPSVDIKKAFNDSFNYNENRGGNSAAIRWVIKIFGVYWKTFGPILFIQSCCIGIYAGYKYLKMEKRKDPGQQQPLSR